MNRFLVVVINLCVSVYCLSGFAQDVPPLSEPIIIEKPDAKEPPSDTPPAEEPAPEAKPKPAEPVPAEPIKPVEPVPAKPLAEQPPPVHSGPVADVPKIPKKKPKAAAPPQEPAATTPPAVPVEEPKEESAQEPAKEEAPKEPVAPPPVKASADASTKADKPEEKHTFAGITLSPQIGYGYFPKSEYDYDGLKLKVDKRNSFLLKFHIDLGGDGIAFIISPLLSMEKIGGDISSFGEDLSGGVSGKMVAIGGETAMILRGSWGRFYPHIGIGFHGAYLKGDDIKYGAEIYGRLPLGFTVYPAKRLGVVVEFALMYGITGIRGPDPDKAMLEQIEAEYNLDASEVDWQNTTPEEVQAQYNMTPDEMETVVEETIGETIKFGKGYGFELMVGIRFP